MYEAWVSVHTDGADWICYRICWKSVDSPRTEEKGHANVKSQIIQESGMSGEKKKKPIYPYLEMVVLFE